MKMRSRIHSWNRACKRLALWATSESRPQQRAKMRSVERDFFDYTYGKQRQRGPQKWRTARPGRDEQEPAVNRRIPKSMKAHNMREEHRPHSEQRQMVQQYCWM